MRTYFTVGLEEIYLVKKLLGHSTVKTTAIYTKFPVEYLKQVFDQRAEVNNTAEMAGVA